MSVEARVAAVADSIAAALTARAVTRDFLDLGQAPDAELVAGRVTVLAMGEGECEEDVAGTDVTGWLSLLVLGQLRVAENTTPRAVEQAENALAEELKAWAVGTALAVRLKGFRQSGQLEHPYGWIAMEMEVFGDA